ncbi:hypothetical protein [Anditalea andensis]|uniref:Uncharacterized protein n=1 Tax=Anditalea andensis TaxID=1048983 RepID=A0A074KUB1_9BACT|nr:hypothetical protein [Anditalea andensis]KEO72499.1 hypothetical protein EL17_17325 [Anditalea andensis]
MIDVRLQKYSGFAIGLLLFILNSYTFAQQRERYEGEYTFNNHDGTATFTFYENRDGEIVIDGNFSFVRRSIDTLDRTLLSKLNVNGVYRENKKHGRWRYDQEEHRVELRDVVDFEVVTDLESEDYELSATYNQGQLEGVWEYRENKFERGRVEPLFRSAPINFSAGKMVGDISFEQFGDYLTYNITGRLDPQGVMVGEWVFTYMRDTIFVRETRRYENGFLLGLRVVDDETREVINEVIFHEVIQNLDRLNQGEDVGFGIAEARFPLTFNVGYRQSFEELQVQQRGNEFLRHVLGRILQYEDEYVDDDGSLSQYPIHTRRFEYPISREDQRNIDEIEETFEVLQSEVNRFAEMNALAINRYRDDSLAFAYEYFQRKQHRLDQVDTLVQILTSDEIRYIDQDVFVREGIDFLSAFDTIRYEFGEEVRTRHLDYEDDLGADRSLTDNVLAYIRREQSLVDVFTAYITQELEQLEQTDDLATMEARILQNKALVDSVYLSHETISNRDLEMFASVYENILQRNFNELSRRYSEMDTYMERVEQGEVILDLISEMREQFNRLAAVFPTMDDLDETYQEETFNPFTYSRYNVRVKERLFDNGGMVLFNHYVSQIRNEEDYTMIKEHLDRIEALQERLYELRDVDTRRIERRLGRRTSINRIESALDL